MSSSEKRTRHACQTALLGVLLLVLFGNASAQRAWLVSDPATGIVLAARNANAPSYPASLVKLMTVYLTIQALVSDELRLDQLLVVSSHAAQQPPVRLGLVPGQTLTVYKAMLATIVRSANDAAVVLSEAVAGSEVDFVARMNRTAREFGMHSTQFRNATGLPHPEQVTTARDLTILVLALQYLEPDFYEIFSNKSFAYGSQIISSHNAFLYSYEGSDGLKTGYTCRSGYNLAASARRKGRRIIGVILGARSAGQRDAMMAKLLNAAFSLEAAVGTEPTLLTLASATDQGHELGPNLSSIASRCAKAAQRELPYMQANEWSIEFAVTDTWDDAVWTAGQILSRGRRSLNGAQPLVIPHKERALAYRVGVTGLENETAVRLCDALRKERPSCAVLSPEETAAALRKGRKALR